jgi:hypothetical protein
VTSRETSRQENRRSNSSSILGNLVNDHTTPFELQRVEWKKTLAETREAFESLCGMLNAETAEGIVVFGIAPDGSVCGIEPGNLDKAQRSLAQRAGEKFEPKLQLIIEVEKRSEGNLIVLRAQRP